MFYNSGDPEFKDPIGQLIALNTINCDTYKFSYSESIIAIRINDQSNVLLTNFAVPVNGATTSGDYLSLLTANYMNSPYIVSVTLTVSRPD